MIRDTPPAAVFVSHHVADYERWKKGFDEHKSTRLNATCLGHHIGRGAEDPNMVYVYCPASDPARLKQFVESEELATIMKAIGVDSAPDLTLMTPKLVDVVADGALPGFLVGHPVADYDAWMRVYEEVQDFRSRSGILGHAVSQRLGDPNYVMVYHQADDLGTLRTFLDSPELKEIMQRAGASGPLRAHFFEDGEYAEY